MSRYRAFAIHFAISFAIFLALAWFVIYLWYPAFFFETDGGWQGIRIIVAVDLVLGPLLTLVVFKADKPSLKFDLAAIGVVQLLALTGGVYVVHSERPLAMVHVDGEFFSMNAQAYIDAGLAVPDLSRFPGPWPKWVSMPLPADPVESATFRTDAFRRGTPLRAIAERYRAFDPVDIDGVEAVDPAAILLRDEQSQAVPRWLAKHGGVLTDYRFYRFGARFAYTYLGFDRQRAALGVLGTPVIPRNGS